MAGAGGLMESDKFLYDKALKGMFAMTAVTVISTAFITAPYGRHSRSGWGPSVTARLAWCLMESPTIWLSALLFPQGRMAANPTSIVLLAVFLLHYIHRSLIYPLLRLRLRSPGSPVPLSIAAMAFFYNCYNTYLQVRWISHYGNYTTAWLLSPPFLLGLGIFFAGMYVNIWADSVLLSLRNSKEGGYKIPRGGLYEYVSCPNYFGEILEWLGWAIMTCSLPGLTFFLYTAANLGPRALAHHAWYLHKFPRDYPKSRRVLIPYIY